MEIIIDVRETFADGVEEGDKFIDDVGFGRVEVEELVEMVHHTEVSLPRVHFHTFMTRMYSTAAKMGSVQRILDLGKFGFFRDEKRPNRRSEG